MLAVSRAAVLLLSWSGADEAVAFGGLPPRTLPARRSCAESCVCMRTGAAAMQTERDTAYGLTLVWALVAVYGEQPSRTVRIASLVCIAVSMLLATISLLRWDMPKAPAPSGFLEW